MSITLKLWNTWKTNCLTCFLFFFLIYCFVESVIGLHGLQLFIDAGIPVDRELVSHIIRQVVTERLETLFGYPEPITQGPAEAEVGKYT